MILLAYLVAITAGLSTGLSAPVMLVIVAGGALVVLAADVG